MRQRYSSATPPPTPPSASWAPRLRAPPPLVLVVSATRRPPPPRFIVILSSPLRRNADTYLTCSSPDFFNFSAPPFPAFFSYSCTGLKYLYFGPSLLFSYTQIPGCTITTTQQVRHHDFDRPALHAHHWQLRPANWPVRCSALPGPHDRPAGSALTPPSPLPVLP